MQTLSVATILALPEREVPKLSSLELQWNAIHVCGRRGYHGPFANTELYNAFGDGWEGTGDCWMCWNTVHVPTQSAKRQRAAEIEVCYREYAEQKAAA